MAIKRLVRKEEGKKVTGLCVGLADYFDIDVTIVRLIVVALALSSLLIPTILAYFIASTITPKEGEIT